MNPDIGTSSIGAASFAAILAGLQVALWWNDERYPGFGRWTAAMALFSLAMFGIVWNPPPILWVLVLAPLLIGALTLAVEGCREFRALPPRIWAIYLAGALAWVSAGYFEYIRSLNARIFVFSSFFALTSLVCSFTLLRGTVPGQRIGSRFTGGVFALFAIVSAARVVYYQFSPSLTDFYHMSWFGGASYSAQILLLTSCMFGWLVMADERRRAQLNRQQATTKALVEVVSAANTAKTELMATIGHEVRNPLSGLIATCELMLSTDLTADQEGYVNAMATSLDAVLRLADDILDTSAEPGSLKIELQAFDLRAHLEGIVKLMEPIARAKGLELTTDFSSGIPPLVLGDKVRIRQVITNLVSNSLKFTSRGHVCLAVAFHGQKSDQGELEITVADTGIGISPENIATLFSRDSAAHASTESAYGGRGLGLTISQKLIRLMGGRLEVESVRGTGSTFRISLPLTVPVQASVASHY
jgi:signal transduction histidine kinase